MIVYPAIDLRKGRCVRLFQGDPGKETVFCEEPAEMARRWVMAGAFWLHVVNLDGALTSRLGSAHAPNLRALEEILEAVDVWVQFGGGIRSLEDMEMLFEKGVDRLVLGTSAVRRPALVERAVREFGAERIVVSLDAREGKVVTHGWQKTSAFSPVELGRRMAERGVIRCLYTDVARDGTMAGVNVEATAELARQTGLKVIASGGISSLDDLRALREHEGDGIEGAIIGSALYTGAIDLTQAIRVGLGLED
ncbi:MAG: 1-(5-phosphoribosyl)-5-[(5-phosphoribosylamino)methylideneamino]imidazole-4-carboxamide isomerase [Anaerolineae bacterium]|nr:1-(5-phosphoribosyl)-5-[(5-phosphoribosylamino)methylideneamino]imidazole-4-carboxamide isomerase [Anaerolineae bacterium]